MKKRMTQIFFSLAIMLILSGYFNQRAYSSRNLSTHPEQKLTCQNSTQTATLINRKNTINAQTGLISDSTIFFEDSLFQEIEPEFNEVSEQAYETYWGNSFNSCAIDTNDFVRGKGLHLDYHCHEICETWLFDSLEGIRLLLPSNFDQGIYGIEVSPSCQYFVVFSSYDGPDYMNSYNHRSEIYGFSLLPGHGVHSVRPAFKMLMNGWSIDNVIWINDRELALKTYSENRTLANQDDLNYAYFRAALDE